MVGAILSIGLPGLFLLLCIDALSVGLMTIFGIITIITAIKRLIFG